MCLCYATFFFLFVVQGVNFFPGGKQAAIRATLSKQKLGQEIQWWLAAEIVCMWGTTFFLLFFFLFSSYRYSAIIFFKTSAQGTWGVCLFLWMVFGGQRRGTGGHLLYSLPVSGLDDCRIDYSWLESCHVMMHVHPLFWLLGCPQQKHCHWFLCVCAKTMIAIFENYAWLTSLDIIVFGKFWVTPTYFEGRGTVGSWCKLCAVLWPIFKVIGESEVTLSYSSILNAIWLSIYSFSCQHLKLVFLFVFNMSLWSQLIIEVSVVFSFFVLFLFLLATCTFVVDIISGVQL